MFASEFFNWLNPLLVNKSKVKGMFWFEDFYIGRETFNYYLNFLPRSLTAFEVTRFIFETLTYRYDIFELYVSYLQTCYYDSMEDLWTIYFLFTDALLWFYGGPLNFMIFIYKCVIMILWRTIELYVFIYRCVIMILWRTFELYIFYLQMRYYDSMEDHWTLCFLFTDALLWFYGGPLNYIFFIHRCAIMILWRTFELYVFYLHMRYYDSMEDPNCKGYIDLFDVQAVHPIKNVQGPLKSKSEENTAFEVSLSPFTARNYC